MSKKEKINKEWKRDEVFCRSDGTTVEIRETIYARDYISKAISMERHFNYNGSGDGAFGGAEKWPVLTLKISFEENAFEQRDKMAELLKETVDNSI